MQPVSQKTFLRQLIKEQVKRTLLYETLLYSHSPSVIIPRLNNMGFNKVAYNSFKNVFSILFQIGNDNKERYEKLDYFLDVVGGWQHGLTIAGKTVVGDKKHFLNETSGTAILQYEAKFDVLLGKHPKKLYHLTTAEKLNKILKNGLTPKNSTKFFNYNERIYFSMDENSLINFLKTKSDMIEKINFVVLEINESSLPSAMRFFRDPNFDNGVYTLENITPQAIQPLYNLSVNEKGEIIKTTK